ncbi:MAG: hypothetical protein KA233_01930 [Novosphingobium sp.]|nr:hypothetical protein [Novosphingobium sp.]MBP6554419.1 hypothetical protein [Novosphingobium sp.]
MLTRLLLTLLAACLSLPAIAAPVSHGVPTEQHAQTAAGDCHKPAPQPGDHAQKHDCIGCIARYDGMAAICAATLSPEPLPETQFAAQYAQIRAGPDTPPPRS